MTTFFSTTDKCAVCGQEYTARLIASTSSFGSMDLDTRPPFPRRLTLPYTAQLCTRCGYANYDISQESFPNLNDLIRSEGYQEIFKKELDSVIKQYWLIGYIFEQNKKYTNAAFAYMSSAWACDDDSKTDYAKVLRLKAVDCFLKDFSETTGDNFRAIVLDLYRKSGEFDKAIEFLAKNSLIEKNSEELIPQIVQFEIHLCNIGNSHTYTVEDALDFHKNN